MHKRRWINLVLVVILLVVIILSACIGAVKISASEFFSIMAANLKVSKDIRFQPQQEAVLFSIRFPRVILGVLIGSALGISGSVMQGLFKNPLAEPGLIGISSGASLFAVVVIVLGSKLFGTLSSEYGFYILSVSAFMGACLTSFLVYRLSVYKGKSVVSTLLLIGVAITALCFSFVGLLTYMATDEQLRNITFWNLGSLGGANWSLITAMLPFIVIPLIVLPFFAKALNAMALGESQAKHIGIKVDLIKKSIIILAAMAVGSSVAAAGMIGFIGLIVPHIIRMTFSADHRIVITGSALLGAIVLTLADLVSRTIVAPAELPIGIITAMIGSPVFMYIIFKEQRKKNL